MAKVADGAVTMDNATHDKVGADILPSGMLDALYTLAGLAVHRDNLANFYQAIYTTINTLFKIDNMYVIRKVATTGDLHIPFFIDQKSPLDIETLNETVCEEDFAHSLAQRLFSITDSVHLHASDLAAINDQGFYPYIERDFTNWYGCAIRHNDEVLGCVVIYEKNNNTNNQEHIRQFLRYSTYLLSNRFIIHQQNIAIDVERETAKTARIDLDKQISMRTKEIIAANKVLEQQIIERIKVEEKLKHDAFHDSLTGLPNRALFIDRLSHCINGRKRQGSEDFAVLFLDLDRFKIINDSLGHVVGDKLLEDVSNRLLTCVRPGDTVARVGGDEFCILLVKIDSANVMHRVADRILNAFSLPFSINENKIVSSTSIGITTSRQGYLNAEDAIRDADAALYHAKKDGRNCYALFDDSMHRRVTRRLTIETLLRDAVANDEIYVDYQPVVDIKTQEILLFESLARWHSDALGQVSPAEFIPIAEEIGIIADIGHIVLTKSLAALSQWIQAYPQFEHIGISVNLSSGQFSKKELPKSILDLIDFYGIPHKNLFLEITEGLLIHNFEAANQMLTELNNQQINIMLDDFGTGYSSLSYLHYFPINIIKIDRSFVHKFDNKKNRGIIHSIKALATDLNMQVIAEGIETKEQIKYLTDIGCEYAQGYFYAQPIAEGKVKNYLATKLPMRRN